MGSSAPGTLNIFFITNKLSRKNLLLMITYSNNKLPTISLKAILIIIRLK